MAGTRARAAGHHDEGLLIHRLAAAWFANAILSGRDFGHAVIEMQIAPVQNRNARVCNWSFAVLCLSFGISLRAQNYFTVQIGSTPSAPTIIVNHSDSWRYRRGTNEPQ